MSSMDSEMNRQKPSSRSLVIIGDSNTEGYGLEPGSSYPDLLNHWLKGQAVVHNCGVSGTCVIQKKISDKWVGMPYVNEKAYKKALELKGDLYIVNLGTNDATDGEEDNEEDDEVGIDPYGNLMAYKSLFALHYQGIINDLFTANPQATVLLCIPVPIRKSIWRKHKQVYLEILAEDIRKVAKQRNLKCIDLMAFFMKQDAIDDFYLDDGLHLNVKGAEHVAKVILSELINEG